MAIKLTITCDRCGAEDMRPYSEEEARAHMVGNTGWICHRCEREAAGLPRLPTIDEMSGLVKDFTGGKSLKEYMEELSDESCGW